MTTAKVRLTEINATRRDAQDSNLDRHDELAGHFWSILGHPKLGEIEYL